MATTDQIIDECLLGIGEDPDSLTDPQRMTRASVLFWIDLFYRNHIGKRLRLLDTYSYDESDADHTIASGVGTLPSDFLAISRFYDGDAYNNDPLERITDINDKVDDDDDTQQYMIVSNTEFWIFGTTPTNTPKLYYYKKPTALTDSSASSPSALMEEFHLDPFIELIQKVYESRKRKYNKAINLEVLMSDALDRIENAHTILDDSPKIAEEVW